MKTRIYLLAVLMISLMFIVILNFYSNSPNQQKNGFTRIFYIKPLLKHTGSYQLSSKTLYIAGMTKTGIYMGNYLRPDQVHFINLKQKSRSDFKLNIPDQEKIAWGTLKITIDSPYVYAYEALTPTILNGSLGKNEFSRSGLTVPSFDKGNPISPQSFIVRSFDHKSDQKVLRKLSLIVAATKPFKLAKKQEGRFSTDGILICNPHLNQVIYVYYYHNTFVGLDTILNQKFSGRTIDTITNPQIKVAALKSDHTIRLLNKPLVVNKYAATDGARLYINSALQADNEQASNFTKFTIIDAYDLKDSKYLFSFYLDKHKNAKLYEFSVFNGQLIAIYENYLSTYDLPK